MAYTSLRASACSNPFPISTSISFWRNWIVIQRNTRLLRSRCWRIRSAAACRKVAGRVSGILHDDEVVRAACRRHRTAADGRTVSLGEETVPPGEQTEPPAANVSFFAAIAVSRLVGTICFQLMALFLTTGRSEKLTVDGTISHHNPKRADI